MAAGVGGLVVANTYLAVTAPPLLPPVHAETQRHLWRGFRITYWVAGPEDAPPVVLIHGHHIAASAFEMRRPFISFAEHFRVYLVDLLGYGLSARPPLAYTRELFETLIADFVRDVVGRPAHVVANALSAAHAITAAATSPDLFRSLILICPAGIGAWDTPPSAGQRIAYELLRMPIVGEAMFNVLVSRPLLTYLLRDRLYANPSLVTSEMIDVYYATAHQPGARFAPAAFIGGQLNRDVHHAFGRLERPVHLIWGRLAGDVPVSLAQGFLALNEDARLHVIDDAGLMPQDEQPEAFAELVTALIQEAERE
jgi:pimeloyl-ACP methyl ester carboxylesterase